MGRRSGDLRFQDKLNCVMITPVTETFYWGDMIIIHSINAEVGSNTLGSVFKAYKLPRISIWKKVRSLRFINKELYRLIRSQTESCSEMSQSKTKMSKHSYKLYELLLKNFSRTVVWYSADRMLAWSECGLQIFCQF